MNLYVGNLSYDTSEDGLRAAFAVYGDVSSVNLITDKFSGQSKGFAFIEMANNSEADAAIKGLNGAPVDGRAIKVNQAQPRGQKSGGGGRGRF